MKRKVFAGSAVAAALLFQLTAVSFPAYAAEYDAVQKEEFVSSFSDAETKQVAQYLVDNGLSLEESKDLMKTYEKGLAIIARESENSGIAMYDLEDSADEEIHIDAPFNMYDSLHSVGAETVVGFCNELHAGYGNDMLTDFTQQMIYGHTTGEAFNYANTKNKSNYTEIPVIAGNINKSWANATVKNGDFESNDSSPRYWNYSGDVRILDSLGSYVHDNNLLFMSTGIGSKSDYNSSQVSQVFHIPENATTLTFSYNFISEEPMEWVGDEYDDEFLTNIYAGTSTSTVLRESTNTSTWHRTNITNFYGGDNTMYETQWKTVTIDVEQYAGKAIKLEFNVNNVGDNTYNSAVLIDNVLVA